jgi:hypothetical protein
MKISDRYLEGGPGAANMRLDIAKLNSGVHYPPDQLHCIIEFD